MFAFIDQAPVVFNDPLPESVDVVIIGAGVIGISTAWFLRERGISVLVCDKGRVAGEQSSRNWGFVRATWRDEAEVPIALDSQRAWQDLSDMLGPALGFKQAGILGVAEDEAGLADYASWMSIAKEYGMDTRMLSAAEVESMIDIPKGRWHGGMLTPGDCRAEPFTAVPTIAAGLRDRGGFIREACAVRTVELQAGNVTGVVTEHGAVRSQAVVCAGGAWSSMFLSNLGIRLPQLAVRATVARTAPTDSIFDGGVALKDVFLRRRQDGGYTVATGVTEHFIGGDSFRNFFVYGPARKMASDIRVRLGSDPIQRGFPAKSWSGDDPAPYESHRVLNPEPWGEDLEVMRTRIAERVPGLADVPFAESWAGMIDATPDVVPVMDEVSSHPGLYIATGFSGHGFGIGPGAGRVIAGMVAGDKSEFDLSRFRFSRFSDGSKIVPGPAI